MQTIIDHIEAYKSHNQILDAAAFVIRTFRLEHENFAGFGFRPELEEKSILLTAEGEIGSKQWVNIPKNLFDFDFKLVVNVIAHEMLHVRQKAPGNPIEDRYEREWQAYYEMLFHKVFPLVPDPPLYNQKLFAEKALDYYRKMGEGSELQKKYAAEKKQVENLLEEIVTKRGEKPQDIM